MGLVAQLRKVVLGVVVALAASDPSGMALPAPALLLSAHPGSQNPPQAQTYNPFKTSQLKHEWEREMEGEEEWEEEREAASKARRKGAREREGSKD